MRQCIDDTRKEIALRRARGGGGGGGGGGGRASRLPPGAIAENAKNIKLDEFDEKDREHVMELLLSQERVIGLLYAKTFPTRTKPPATSLPPVSNQERDFQDGPTSNKSGALPEVTN